MSCIADQSPIRSLGASTPLTFGRTLGEEDFRRIRTRLSLDYCKWDSQIGDTCTVFQQPLLMDAQTWEHLKQAAEGLAAELMQAEQELLERPDLYARLGLPPQLRSVLDNARRHGPTPPAARTLRFDFHYTADGWSISEVNSDVPGGYTEASCFSELMAACVPDARPAGNPAEQWTDAMVAVTGEHGRVALLSAPGFLEDQQVSAFLAGRLQARGVETFLLHNPAQLIWKAGHAYAVGNGHSVGIDAIVRFYQGEWLARLNSASGWKQLFAGGKTPVANPGTSLLTESKRFPLVWDAISSRMNTWSRLLPESCDPARVDWQHADEWVFKAAFSNTGDSVHMRESMDQTQWRKFRKTVQRHPEHWAVQKRFEPVPVASEAGAVYPCIGVYTIDGRAAGVYARASNRRIIDHAAMDVAVLIDEKRNAEQG